ncbi:hypothetical protein [Tabrizicola aquatica]|uniref:hypothetical protein n=1 Tax=Tabrizicola aquatica TaxID=909926 RepID=UPI0015E18FF0|nr:hypothetical protein [Tabrizicola aquatica]
MGSRPDALNAAIAQAWQAFDLPAPAETGVCQGCCMDPGIEADFLKRQARDLPPAYVRDWYSAAHTDRIRHAHVAWFLPRVLEMLADGQHVAAVGDEVAFARLPLTGFPDRWPERQVAALNQFALAFLEMKLAVSPPMGLGELDRLLCMFGEGGLDLAPLLQRLEALGNDDLAGLLHRCWFHLQSGRIGLNAFWSREPGKTTAWAWYTSASLLNRMEEAALAGNETALEVYDLIATVRAADGL